MGFFGKIFKGVKKGFKKIGKGIKSAFKKFGKFMGKIGVLGQIAMMFILPSIGGALMQGLGSIGTKITGALAGSGSAVLQGAGKVLQGAANFISKGANVFRNVTEGVTNFIGEFSKTAANKLSSTLGFERVPFADASANFFGAGDTAWSRSTSSFTNRMTNLTADKDFIKGLDATSRDMAINSTLPEMEGFNPNQSLTGPQVSPATNPLTGKPYTASNRMDSLLSPESVDLDGFTDKIVSGEKLADPVNLELASGTTDKIMEDAADTSWWDKFKTNTRETFDYETENLGSTTIKKTTDAFTNAPAQFTRNEINKLSIEDPEEQFGTIGAAQQQMMGIGETQTMNPNQFAVNYGVQIAQAPYGNNALMAGIYGGFMNNSLSTTG